MRHLAPLLALALGCADEPTAVVRVCTDLAPGVAAQQVRLTLFTPDLSAQRFAGVRDVVAQGGPSVDAGPALDAGAADAGTPPACAAGWQGRFEIPEQPEGAWVEVQALVDGLPTVTGRARMRDQAAAVVLQAACEGVACPAGQTCLDGACAAAPEGDDGAACALECAP